MKLQDIKDGIAVDMEDVKAAEKISFKGIGKYVLIRFIGIICFFLALAGVVFILHYFDVSVNF